jgi:hypothetical protein
MAFNAGLDAGELASTSAIQILRTDTLAFQNLQIGANNNIGGAGLGLADNSTHGWENGLNKRIQANDFSVSSVKLVKTGWGGTIISSWNVGGTLWNQMIAKMDAAKAIDSTLNPIIFYSQGINDAVAGTSTSQWKTDTAAHWAALRTRYGANIPIIAAKFQTAFSTFSTALDELAAVTANCWTVQTDDLPLQDGNHWGEAGMETMAYRMIDKLKENYNL